MQAFRVDSRSRKAALAVTPITPKYCTVVVCWLISRASSTISTILLRVGYKVQGTAVTTWAFEERVRDACTTSPSGA